MEFERCRPTSSVWISAKTTGNKTFEALEERDHDDPVLAIAIAGWYAEGSRSVR
jgi:hypothetical protein